MQRYRVNYVLLASLVVGGLVASGAGYGLWTFQVDRNSGSVLKRAKAARQDEKVRESAGLYQQYLAIKPDDTEALKARAEIWKLIAESSDHRPEDIGIAFKVMEDTVRSMPEDDELRRELIDLWIKYRQYKESLEHARLLLNRHPEDVEIQVLYSRCLFLASNRDAESFAFRLIGYDRTNDTFDVDAAKAPHEPEVYRNLASRLRKEDDSELADRVMDQLIEVNPDDFKAHLTRSRYFLVTNEGERSEDDIRKAYELNSTDADVLISIAAVEKNSERYREANKHLEDGVTKYPKDPRFYQMLAEVAMREQDYESALSHVNRGIEAISTEGSLVLLAFKADLQIRELDIEGTMKTIEVMRERNFRPEYVEWIEARVMLIQSKWYEASIALEDVRQQMSDFPDIRLRVEVQLALCYEKLGKLEMALDLYQIVLRNNPKNNPADVGRQRVLGRLGQPQNAEAQGSWKIALQEELKKPESEQNWPRVTRMLDDVADKMNLSEAGQVLLKAEIFMMRKKYPESRKMLEKAFEMAPDDLSVQRAAVRLLRQDPELGPVNALEFLEGKVIPQFGDRPDLRIEKADLLIAINDSELVAQLDLLTQGIEDWSDQNQMSLWYALGARYFSLGLVEKAQQCWGKVAELAPNDLPTRLMLFTIAHDANDEAGMRTAQEKILEVIDKSDATYLYTEARRMLSLFKRGKAEKETLNDIDTLVKNALVERPEWHDLHLITAELAMIRGNYDLALKSYELASRLGRPYPSSVVQHVRLLVAKGRFEQAKIVVDRLPEATRQRLLGQLYTEILFNSRLIPQAMESGQKVVDADPLNAAKQLWYGKLMVRVAQQSSAESALSKKALENANIALQKAVEMGPRAPEAWITLISFHVGTRNRDAAEKALREAQLAISSEQMPGVLAKCYEIMGRAFDAEKLYQAAYDANPENPALARQLATFYLGSANQLNREQKKAKATPLLNSILKAHAAGKLETTEGNVVWARRKSAELLAMSGDYQNLLKAEKLLASNSQNGQLPLQDMLQLSQILSTRPEPVSRLKAVQLLEDVRAVSRLNVAAELTLGQLYFMVGDWPKAESQMLEVTARFPDIAQIRVKFIQMLLRQDDARQARRHLKKLIELAPRNLVTLELMARVSARNGQEQAARAALRRVLPKDLSEIKDEDLSQLEKVADLLSEELNDKDNALKMYQLLVSRKPDKFLKLAGFIGRNGEVAKSFEMLGKVYKPEVTPAIVNTALAVIRSQRDKVGTQYDEQIQSWLDRGLRENPDSIALNVQQANLFDTQQKYDEAIGTYRALLKDSNFTGSSRAIVLNNLCYLLAIKGDAANGNEAIDLVDEAVFILGPTADILDTRAVVFIAKGRYEDAIADLELSVTDNPTASKYFHKAIAHLKAGQNSNALEAWAQAQQLGMNREELNPLEQLLFDDIAPQIEQLQATTAGVGVP